MGALIIKMYIRILYYSLPIRKKWQENSERSSQAKLYKLNKQANPYLKKKKNYNKMRDF